MTEAEFEQIVKQYNEKLYWYIRRMVNNHEDANDILQNTFIKAWTKSEQFRNESKISTWLYKIATNECFDFLRKEKHTTNGMSLEDAKILAGSLQADSFFDGDEVQAKFQAAISTLPPVQKNIFTMKYFDEMKYSDMSKILGTSEGALKASFHLAVKKISAFFSNED